MLFWLFAIVWMAAAMFLAGAYGYSVAIGEKPSMFDRSPGSDDTMSLFAITTWVLFFYAAIPAFIFGWIIGSAGGRRVEEPKKSFSPSRSDSPRSGHAVQHDEARTLQCYMLWTATRRTEDWASFTASLHRDVLAGGATVTTVQTRYPEAAASPELLGWVSRMAAEGA